MAMIDQSLIRFLCLFCLSWMTQAPLFTHRGYSHLREVEMYEKGQRGLSFPFSQ